MVRVDVQPLSNEVEEKSYTTEQSVIQLAKAVLDLDVAKDTLAWNYQFTLKFLYKTLGPILILLQREQLKAVSEEEKNLLRENVQLISSESWRNLSQMERDIILKQTKAIAMRALMLGFDRSAYTNHPNKNAK